MGIQFPVTMRTAPTITLYGTDSGSSGNIWDITGSANIAAATGIIGETSESRTTVFPNGVSTTANNLLAFQWIASAEL